MRKKITMSILLAALSMTVLSGCGGKNVSKTVEPQKVVTESPERKQYVEKIYPGRIRKVSGKSME